MTFTIDTYTLNVTEFSETSQPIGAEWRTWENERMTLKQFTYGVLRVWTLRCIEVNVAWSSSAAKYLQDKMRAGEKVTFSVNEGDMHQVTGVQCYVKSVDIRYGRGSTRSRFKREFTIILRETSTK